MTDDLLEVADAVDECIAEARRLRRGGFTLDARKQLGRFMGERLGAIGLTFPETVAVGLQIMRNVEAEPQA